MAVKPQPEPVQASMPRKKKRGCFSCGLIALLVGVFVLLWIGWVVAASGLVRIPVLSSVAFQEPKPVRVVEPSNVTPEAWLESRIVTEFTRRIRSGDLHNRRVTLTVPEGVLTMLVRGSGELIDIQDIPFDFSLAQVAVVDENLEVFLPVEDTKTALRIEITPSIGEDGLDVRIDTVRVGSWRAPRWLVRAIVNQAMRLGADQIEDSIGSVIMIEDIVVAPEGLVITGELSPDAIRF